jgi:hypothetical protein
MCPICLHEFQPDLTNLYRSIPGSSPQPLPGLSAMSTKQREDAMRSALVLCPSKTHGDTGAHYLEVDFVRHDPPIVIGLVGTSATGKSTLLATLINEVLENNALRDYGIRTRALARSMHENFRQKYIDKLAGQQSPLDRTEGAAQGVRFADGMLLIRDPDLHRPVVFFDVGGESFFDLDEVTLFINSFTALIFVVDPARLTGREADRDRTFGIVADRLTEDGKVGQYLEQPAAIVLAKADMLRFEPVIARWLTQQGGITEASADQLQAESRDIFAFLYQRRADWSLIPFDIFRRCTLHAVSATGASVPEPTAPGTTTGPAPTYPRPLRPRRVLDPFVAILAMEGVIDFPGADKVGAR